MLKYCELKSAQLTGFCRFAEQDVQLVTVKNCPEFKGESLLIN